jgi:hypothetical protein
VKPAAPRTLITLLTDFGARYACGASLKSSFLSLNPIGPLVDLSPAMDPQAIRAGAFMLAEAAASFPPGPCTWPWWTPGWAWPRRFARLKICVEKN